MKTKILNLKKFESKKKIICLTAYSKPFAKILDNYCDIILIGDSMATAFYGMENTSNLSIETMINHGTSVKKGSKKSIIVFDMPINSYRNINEAKRNVRKVLNKVRCDAIKIESNGRNFNIINSLVKLNIPVMGHIGYTPQFKKKFKVQGLIKKEEDKLIEESLKIQSAGAFSIVLECISQRTAKKITETLKIPTIGIGSSRYCDGQILVTDDLLGLSGFKPKFVKKYINIQEVIKKAIKRFSDDVRKNKFPLKEHTF